MRMRVGLAALGLLLLLPAAVATYGSGSALEADAPATLNGRVDALLAPGVASFVSADPRTTLAASITAREIHLTHHAVVTCEADDDTPYAGACSQVAGDNTATEVVQDARVTVTRTLQAYKLVVANDDGYADTSSFGAPGPLVVTTGAGTLLGATTSSWHLSPFDGDWSASPQAYAEPVYTVEVLEPALGAVGGSLRATGGFEALLQGVEVKVEGKRNGEPFAETYRTDGYRSGGNRIVQYLVIEAERGDIRATSAARLSAYGAHAVDVRDSVTLARATGTVVQDGARRAHEAEDLTLPGPVELTITAVKPGTPPRLAFALSSQLRVLDAHALDEKPTTQELVAAGAAGMGGGALLAAAVYFWPRLRYAASLLLVPLYTRIGRQEVLEHDKRDEIYELIRASPGIHAHEIGSRANIGWGTTVYHLKLLEEHSLIVSKKSGRYKRFFVNTGEFTKKKDVYGALRNETAKGVADFVVNHPGCSQKELCAALGIQPSLASWHVSKLEQVDLVKRVKDGRLVRYYAGPAWRDLNVRILPGGGAETVAET